MYEATAFLGEHDLRFCCERARTVDVAFAEMHGTVSGEHSSIGIEASRVTIGEKESVVS